MKLRGAFDIFFKDFFKLLFFIIIYAKIVSGDVMKDIKEIIAKNIIELRKKNNLTQNELAEKLNYSDNTVSRWEHAEITPSVETLQQISQVFDVEIESLLQENAVAKEEKTTKSKITNSIVTMLLLICQVWFIVAVCYFYIKSFQGKNPWILFVWAVPCSMLIVIYAAARLKNRVFIFVAITIFIWTFLTALYLHFLQYNLYLIYIIGIPTQATVSIWSFLKKKKPKVEIEKPTSN